MALTELEQGTLAWLREEYAADPEFPQRYAEELAEELGTDAEALANDDFETGALYRLLREGLVDRFGAREDGYSWAASGAEVEFRWPS